MRRKLAMSVRPSSHKFSNWGGGRCRCDCCSVLLSEGAAFPIISEDGEVPGPAVPEGKEEIELEASVEEARTRKDIPRPYAPTAEEIAKHRIDHLPYRNRCPEFVEGFARERAHHAHEGSDRETHLVSCDYLYITPGGYLPVMNFLKVNARQRGEYW